MRRLTVLLAVVTALVAPAAATEAPETCPSTFTVLHDDRIGTFQVPAGHYQLHDARLLAAQLRGRRGCFFGSSSRTGTDACRHRGSSIPPARPSPRVAAQASGSLRSRARAAARGGRHPSRRALPRRLPARPRGEHRLIQDPGRRIHGDSPVPRAAQLHPREEPLRALGDRLPRRAAAAVVPRRPSPVLSSRLALGRRHDRARDEPAAGAVPLATGDSLPGHLTCST